MPPVMTSQEEKHNIKTEAARKERAMKRTSKERLRTIQEEVGSDNPAESGKLDQAQEHLPALLSLSLSLEANDSQACVLKGSFSSYHRHESDLLGR